MVVNTALQMMKAGQPAFGYSLAMGSPLNSELISRSGIDFVMVDRQHGSWGDDSTNLALAVMQGSPATPMARVARNDYTLIGRLLDEGVMGIIVPMIHTPEEAKAVADACRFPPVGNRSWGWGRARAMGSDYPAWIGDQLFVAVQIESALAVENVEAIMATPGIDGCWTGPSDLSFSLGFHPKEMDDREEHARALEKVVEACRNTDTIPGIAGRSLADAKARADQGFQFITAGSDAGFIIAGSTAGVDELRAYREGSA
jgi:4-hydroxy-2-oxoheptanedioate aldolase